MAPNDETACGVEPPISPRQPLAVAPAVNCQASLSGKGKLLGFRTTAQRRTSVTMEDVAPDWHFQRADSDSLPRLESAQQSWFQGPNRLSPALPRSHSTFSTQKQQLSYVVKRLDGTSAGFPVSRSWISTDAKSPRSSVSSVMIAAAPTPETSLPRGQILDQKAEKRNTASALEMKLPAAAAAKEQSSQSSAKQGVSHIAQLKQLESTKVAEQAAENDDDDRATRIDLDGLIEYLDAMKDRNGKFTEATYVVNAWRLGGIIPLKHHGFILKAEDNDYLTVDFTRRGIIWDMFDEYPELPEGTMHAKRHSVNLDPAHLKFYCQTTKPFAWPGNDCSHWARGLLQIMMVHEDPHGDHGAFPDMSKCSSTSCTGAGGLNPLALMGLGCFSS